MPDVFLTVTDLAQRWRVSRATIHRRISDGTIPATILNPQGKRKNYRIRLSEVEAIEDADTS